MEVQAIVSADVSPLLLQLSILSLQELRQTRFGPLGPANQYVGHGGPLDGAVAAESEAGWLWMS